VRVKWSLEIKEQFSDLSIISMITANKSTVKVNFEDGIYIKGRRTEFEKVPVCGGKLEVWLQVDKEKKEFFGKEFLIEVDPKDFYKNLSDLLLSKILFQKTLSFLYQPAARLLIFLRIPVPFQTLSFFPLCIFRPQNLLSLYFYWL